MSSESRARIIEEGSRLAGEFIRAAILRPRKSPAPVSQEAARTAPEKENVGRTSHEPEPPPILASGSQDQPPIENKIDQKSSSEQIASITKPQRLPTREETTKELKRRLAKELYRAELDLSSKLRIAGAPCDCLDSKHTLGIEAAAEELIAQEPENPVYFDIIGWIDDNHTKITIEAIASGKYDDEYPKMASQFKDFRKRVMGTAAFSALQEANQPLTLGEAKTEAAKLAQEEVEKLWQSQEKS